METMRGIEALNYITFRETLLPYKKSLALLTYRTRKTFSEIFLQNYKKLPFDLTTQ